MKNPAFTAQEVVNVYLSRWFARKVANEFIGYLRREAAGFQWWADRARKEIKRRKREAKA